MHPIACAAELPERRTVIAAANLALKFVLELAAFAALAVWGATIGDGVIQVLVAVAAPLTAIVLWGVFAAPKSSSRLSTAPRVAFELAVFGLAVAALAAAGKGGAAIVLAAAVAVNFLLLARFGQLES